jgi:LytS/YehU family sensor histidine kinase
MSALWFNFAILVFVQLLVFLVHAYYEKKLADVSHVLWWGAISGLIVGPPVDLIIGKYLGVGTYLLGFGPFFLILLAIFGWGLGFANIFLMQQARVLHFCIWMMIVIVVSEILNLFLLLWTWQFAMLSIEYVMIALIAPLALAMAIAYAWHILFGYRFVFIDDMFKR